MTDDAGFPMSPPPLLDDDDAYRTHRALTDDAETLAHLEYLDRVRRRLWGQIGVARGALENLERDAAAATDRYEVALANYQRAAARPLIET